MTVYLDTETTGLHGGQGDEIVEIAIIDDDGHIILNSLIKPTSRKSWPKAEEIHGISPKMVSKAPSLQDMMPLIREAVTDTHVVIYNSAFDVRFFPGGTLDESFIECCMLRYAKQIGQWDDYREGYKWHKLIAAAKHVGHVWTGDAHRALADTLATRSVWNWLETQSPSPKIQQMFGGGEGDECPNCYTEFYSRPETNGFCLACGYIDN